MGNAELSRYAKDVKPRDHPLFTRSDKPVCPKCGFSLQGLGPEGTCPECGTAYDAASAYPSGAPTTLRALWYGAKPLVLGGVPAGAACFALLDASLPISAVTQLFVTAPCIAVAVGCVAWSAWRSVLLIDAIMQATPRLREERPAMRVLGLSAMGVLGVVGVLSLGACFTLTLMVGACLLRVVR